MLIYGKWLRIWLDGQEFRRNKIGRMVTKRSGEEICRWISWNENRV